MSLSRIACDEHEPIGLNVETLEFSLIVLACIIASSVINMFARRIALPLVQIAIGFLVALVIPNVVEVQLSSDLFLVLFIAPLLFNEARRSSRIELWENKGSILSLAVCLVIVTVLVVGFTLNLIVPSIPLAAAFACAAALGPTDAAAVSALGSIVGLKKRQETLLSGESLVNDASGVVSFQFAVAAVVTGTFSLIDAAESFIVLFFGGIAVGLAIGALAKLCTSALRRIGYEDTVLHVIYEVFTPFFVFLAAEWLNVSSILAVVAAGLVMADRAPRLTSIDAARRQLVSDNFWKVIVFLINGIIFVMLGMQLPLALSPSVAESFTVPMLLAIVVVLTLLLFACRFVWLAVMELFHKGTPDGERGFRRFGKSLKNALVMTIAGPKGAVTLSIIFTIPFTLANGEAFPQRDLIIFLSAGVILATLLAANFILPLLAPREKDADDADEAQLHRALVEVLGQTIRELQRRIADGQPEEYIPALRLTLARYQARYAQARESELECGKCMSELNQEVLNAQQRRADELQSSSDSDLTEADAAAYYSALRSIRASVGYVGHAAEVGSRFSSLSGRLRLLFRKAKPTTVTDEQSALVYYDTCLFAIELEYAALDYLNEVAGSESDRCHTANVLIEYHKAALRSLWGRINFGYDDDEQIPEERPDVMQHASLPEGMRSTLASQFEMVRRYADEADENALTIELDCIRHLQESGDISDDIARELRHRVYALQGALEGAS